MERVQTMNPFSRRDSYDKRSVFMYRALTILSWLLVVVLGVLFAFLKTSGLPTIWDQNKAHPTPFALNPILTTIYWAALLFLQMGYVYFLFRREAELVNAAANVGSHYILNNVIQVAFMAFFVHGEFCWCEILLVINFFNLKTLYFRHRKSPPFVHIPVVSGPLAWNFVALFWVGAIVANAQSLGARIAANIFVWSFLLYGVFFVAAFKDHAMGFELSILSAALAVEQFLIKAIALQWMFAFVIMALLFLLALAIIVPDFFGKELTFMRDDESEPLLDEDD